MKLLIVDDEELTRTGVISSIDWNALGIDEVLQADDGVNGLETARLHRPEIILCDVRMPRMDGIDMLERLESFLPDTIAIFMSGYSDKEYLKAAIRLKAVSYIEKPLNPAEIREAVLEAQELYKKNVRGRRAETIHSMETASRLALHLTMPYEAERENISLLLEELNLPVSDDTFFTAVIVKTSLDGAGPTGEKIHTEMAQFLAPYGLSFIYTQKHSQYLVYFLFGANVPSKADVQAIGAFLADRLSFEKYFIAAGETVCHISRAYDSYSGAVILLQSSFFFPCGSLLTAEEDDAPQAKLPDDIQGPFARALSAKDAAACFSLLETLWMALDRNRRCLQNQAKDIYYKLFLALEDASRQLSFAAPAAGNISDEIERCFTCADLHRTLLDKTQNYFAQARAAAPENPTITLIKEYIGKHYMNEALSVKDISSHVFLSTSYVCTFFKNETGQTLNQFITEYRMEQAKLLLADPRFKIADISFQVGYSDGNYFGKSFKKYSGFSPSEYREKMVP